MSRHELISNAEEVVDKFLRHSKTILPTIARLCLVSTFIENGFRMCFQWSTHVYYLSNMWNCDQLWASLFVLTNLLTQLIGSALVLTRINVTIACIILFAIIILQDIAYSLLWNLNFLIRNMSICGSLILLVVESKAENKSLFAGIPSLGENRHKTYLQLSGRILIILLFATILRLELSLIQIIVNIIAIALMTAVTIGYKTKLSAFVLVVWLSALNAYVNPFWTYDSNHRFHDFYKYNFFQVLSVIGGLLMIVLLGPGGISVDDHKKRWPQFLIIPDCVPYDTTQLSLDYYLEIQHYPDTNASNLDHLSTSNTSPAFCLLFRILVIFEIIFF